MEATRSVNAGAAVPEPVRELVDRHLRGLDRAVPGLVDMLYLTGSVALDDYRPGASDVDFLAVTSRPLTDIDLAAIKACHTGMPATPHYDGVYLDRESFDAVADDGQIVPHVVDGEFLDDQPCGELNPVLWLVLARYGVAVRGPAAADLGLHVDPQRLRRWNLDNLNSYWQPFAGKIREAVAGRSEDAKANPVGVVWGVLGPARLHYTLATGGVTSKTGAGRYAAEHFPAWADLVERAIGWRDGRDVDFVTADALAMTAMVDAVVEDARRRWA